MRIHKGKMVCPKCGTDTTFITVAHVAQDWEVDPEGNFIRATEECCETVADPDTENIWTCTKCGSEGVYRNGL